MRVLIFSSKSSYRGSRVGGAELSLKLLAERLVERGHDVTFLTRQNGRLGWFHRRKVDGVPVVALPRLRLPGSSWRWIRPVSRAFDYLAFLLYLLTPEGRGVEVLHTFATIPDARDALRARRLLRARFCVVTRMAGLYWHELAGRSKVARRWVEWTLANVDCVNFISAGLKNMFFEIREQHNYRIPLEDSFVGDIGVDRSVFARRWEPPSTPGLVMVARFIDRAKRHDLVIRALETRRLAGVTLHLVGDGPTRDRWMKYCRRRPSLSERVHFYGQLSRAEVAELLARASIFCLATDYEGLSKSVIEAMAVGTPVCVSDVAPLNSYVKDGDNGFLVENEVECWSKKLADLLEAPEILTSASMAASRFVNQQYDPDEQVLLYEREFERVLRKSSARHSRS